MFIQKMFIQIQSDSSIIIIVIIIIIIIIIIWDVCLVELLTQETLPTLLMCVDFHGNLKTKKCCSGVEWNDFQKTFMGEILIF